MIDKLDLAVKIGIRLFALFGMLCFAAGFGAATVDVIIRRSF